MEILKFTGGTSQPQKPISAAFEPHLGIFVDAQDKYGAAFRFGLVLLTFDFAES